MCNLHWCCTFCSGITLFALVLHLNCTALSQSESSNFFMYIIKRIINMIASIWGTNMLVCCPWTLSVPQSLQFSASYALGKLFVSWKRQCPQTNILAYFSPKWRLLFICLLIPCSTNILYIVIHKSNFLLSFYLYILLVLYIWGAFLIKEHYSTHSFWI